MIFYIQFIAMNKLLKNDWSITRDKVSNISTYFIKNKMFFSKEQYLSTPEIKYLVFCTAVPLPWYIWHMAYHTHYTCDILQMTHMWQWHMRHMWHMTYVSYTFDSSHKLSLYHHLFTSRSIAQQSATYLQAKVKHKCKWKLK